MYNSELLKVKRGVLSEVHYLLSGVDWQSVTPPIPQRPLQTTILDVQLVEKVQRRYFLFPVHPAYCKQNIFCLKKHLLLLLVKNNNN